MEVSMINLLYNDVKNWMYRNARQLELSLWQFYFENGSKDAVLNALMFYQNEDGGFGHALEPDNWNPNSTPITTNHAIKILHQIDFVDMSHPIYKGIWNYLKSGSGMTDYGWCFTIPSNDDYPRAPWWNYSEEQNKNEYYGITAELASFILKYGDYQTDMWKKAKKFATDIISIIESDISYGDMGLEGVIILIDTVKEILPSQYNYENLDKILNTRIEKSIEHDVSKWQYYSVRPSNYIKGPESRYYQANKEILQKELDYLINTKPENDVWGITWTWFDNMQKYEASFHLSENWWKSLRALENIHILRKFSKI